MEHDIFFLANLFIQQITIQESISYARQTRAYCMHAKVSFWYKQHVKKKKRSAIDRHFHVTGLKRANVCIEKLHVNMCF